MRKQLNQLLKEIFSRENQGKLSAKNLKYQTGYQYYQLFKDLVGLSALPKMDEW
jgi:hypothetical protein